jgi:hypothetical protein
MMRWFCGGLVSRRKAMERIKGDWLSRDSRELKEEDEQD